MASHSSTLAWEISWMEELGNLQSMGSLRVGHDWATSLSLFTFMHWRRKWQPTPVFLPGESQGREPGRRPSMGSHRVGHDWRDLAAAAEGLEGVGGRPTREGTYIYLWLKNVDVRQKPTQWFKAIFLQPNISKFKKTLEYEKKVTQLKVPQYSNLNKNQKV